MNTHIKLPCSSSKVETSAKRSPIYTGSKTLCRSIQIYLRGGTTGSTFVTLEFNTDQELYDACKQFGIDHIEGMENMHAASDVDNDPQTER